MSTKDTTVTTLDDAPATQTARQQPQRQAPADNVIELDGAPNLSGKKKTLTIHQSDADGGTEDVFVGLNGYAYQIKRGIPVKVPVEVIQIIEDAKVTKYKTEGKETREFEVPRYAYSVS